MNQKLLTEKEQEDLINDLTMLEAVLIAQQQYLLSIGKLEECKKFVQKFLKDLQENNKEKEQTKTQ